MSTQNSTGIQTLLDAERDASQIIQQARECKWHLSTGKSAPPSSSWLLVRTKRVKEARDEARQEVTSYQRTKESSFKDFQAEV
jgi:V-type H+-transporting ATPase subunit G